MPNLVGIGLSQVPTNSMLGGLAYQSPDHASIKDLDLKNLSQINSEIADTAVDIFIYDTSKDSDGGAWRKRTTHTSWYNETLNTTTRGSRREFPAVAVLVLEGGKLTIYDGDDPDLPMWMVFNTNATEYYLIAGTNDHDLRSVAALNGIIVTGNASGYNHGGAIQVNFVKDDGFVTSHTTNKRWTGGILNRNSNDYWVTLGDGNYIVSNSVNDVAMTVLPNAPIDDATGLPVPTIAVGTGDGVSIIKDDGTVIDYIHGSSTYDLTSFVEFLPDNRVAYAWDNNVTPRRLYITPILSADTQTVTSTSYPIDSVGTVGYGRPADSKVVGNYHGHLIGSDQSVVASMSGNQLAVGDGSDGLNLVDVQAAGDDTFNSLVAFATTSYNTGWMHGDIKGAFLSDTVVSSGISTVIDRSVNNNGLEVFGTITTSAVATGADLVAYSGFSTSNYLLQPPNSDLAFGNNAFSVMCWFKTSQDHSATDSAILIAGDDGSNQLFDLRVHSDEKLLWQVTDDAYTSRSRIYQAGPAVDDGVWHCVVGTRTSDNKTHLYLDGNLIGSSTSESAEANLSNSIAFSIGIENAYDGTKQKPWGGSIALARISKSAPSAEQIKKIYEDEKVLFQENAKATLYGSSDAVTALAYDEVTDRLHVGTSSGRSDFQGLRRINNTTTAVTTAISAHDEFIVEQ